MKWFFHLFVMRIKATWKMPLLWFLLIFSGALSVVPITAYFNQTVDTVPIAIVDFDQGPYADEFFIEISEFSGLSFIQEDSLDEAQRKLSVGKYEGIVVILENFSEDIEKAEFKQMLSIYISPSSSVTSLLSEVMAEKVVEIWAQEYLIQDYQELKREAGVPFSGADLQQLRLEIEQAIQSEEIMVLDIHTGSIDLSQTNSGRVESAAEAIKQSVLYYSSMTIIFVFVSGRWVIDQRRNGIGLRMLSLGITPVLSVLASSTAMAVFCTSILTLVIFIFGALLSIPFGLIMGLIATAFLYFISIIGLALIFTSFVSESISLLLVSPLAVLINSLLGGMFYPLPEWAVTWQKISIILPGRMLKQALFTDQYLPLILGAVVYLSIGVIVASRIRE
jgi:hypothetical protein